MTESSRKTFNSLIDGERVLPAIQALQEAMLAADPRTMPRRPEALECLYRLRDYANGYPLFTTRVSTQKRDYWKAQMNALYADPDAYLSAKHLWVYSHGHHNYLYINKK